MADPTPTTHAELVEGLEKVAAIQDPAPWDVLYYWPFINGQQPILLACYVTAEEDEARFVFSEPLDDTAPDTDNFQVRLVSVTPGNARFATLTTATVTDDWTVSVGMEDPDDQTGTAGAEYLGGTAPSVVSADGKEPIPSTIPYTQEL